MIIRTALAACVLLASTYGASAHEPGECRFEIQSLQAAVKSFGDLDEKSKNVMAEIGIRVNALMTASANYAKCAEGSE